ncbi:hypothetical protein ACHWQZ_G003629 [Mnemiopsis leidyi]
MSKIICTSKRSLKYRWSFPSGHSAEAWYSVTLSILIVQYTRNITTKYSQGLSLVLPLKATIQCILIAFASWVGITRTLDEHHFWWDVLAGSFLGAFIAVVMFFWFIKPVMENTKDSNKSFCRGKYCGISMLSRRLARFGGVCCRNLSYYDRSSKGPDMSKDTLFDENFEVRKQLYTKKINPIIEFTVSRWWKFKMRIQIYFGAKIPELKSEEEVQAWNELMYRLEEFYLEIPQTMPDQRWFNDVVDHYTKYNDYEGALDMFKWIDEHDIWVNIDQDVMDKLELFFEINDPKSLTQLSDHQAKLREELLVKFKEMSNNPERWYKKRHVAINKGKHPADQLPEGDRIYTGGGY